MMAGYLLARAGIDVTVLEKHADFLRDFRGDTIHPSTMDALAELGLLDDFLRLPHQEVRYAEIEIGGERVRVADFGRLATRCKFIAFIPQWDFLNFMAEQAKAFPSFSLMMETEAIDLLREGERVAGVIARSPSDELELRADLVIAADGRDSMLRQAAGLKVRDLGAPMDVLWFRLRRGPEEPGAVLGRIKAGGALVMLDRGDYWQCAFIIRKGTADAVKAQGLDAFRARVAEFVGPTAAQSIASLDDVKLLTVKVDRLETWHKPGLLVHRRCRSCHVARRRRRHQPRHPGRHCRGQPAGRTAAARCSGRGRPAQGPAAARVSDLGDSGLPDGGAEPRHRPGAPGLAGAEAALARALRAAAPPLPAGHSGADHRRRVSPGARGPRCDRWTGGRPALD